MTGLTQLQKQHFLDLFGSMTVQDAAEMKSRIKAELGIEPLAAIRRDPVEPPPPTPPEPSLFEVVLVSAGDRKIQVIKAVRELTSLGLKEAKQLVDSAPVTIRAGVDADEAESLAGPLGAAGAQVSVNKS